MKGVEVKLTNRGYNMLSTKTRLRLEDIAARIAGGLNVSFEEMTFIQKWADKHTTARTMLRKARRKAANEYAPEGSLDDFMEKMDLGDPDPSNHLTSESTPEDFFNFFKRNDTDDWRTRD